MKILLINKFLYHKGGDAVYTLNLGALLRSRGHEVIFWGMDHPFNPDYPHKDLFVPSVDYNEPDGIAARLKMAANILYSFEAKRKIETLVKIEMPDMVHLNNFAHQISPSILDVFKKYNIPVVMTMHDYKLVCASYLMYYDTKICEACRRNRHYNVFLKRCFKNSRLKSLIGTLEMYLHHKFLHIYNSIDIFISPSEFLESKLKEMKFDKNIIYLPNFIYPDEFVPQPNFSNMTIVYFGRLSHEKGLYTLLKTSGNTMNITLNIIGDGPIRQDLEDMVKKEGIKNINFLGYKTGSELKNEISKSMFVVIPSEWYENNPFSILESFALGKPVIGSDIGGIPELVKNDETGFLFRPGDVEDLRKKILSLAGDRKKIEIMGRNARKFVEENFNPEKHYEGLMKIYKEAIKKHSK